MAWRQSSRDMSFLQPTPGDKYLGCPPLVSLTWSELPPPLLWGLQGPHPIAPCAQRWCCFPRERFILGTEGNHGGITGIWLIWQPQWKQHSCSSEKGRIDGLVLWPPHFNLPRLRSQPVLMEMLPSLPTPSMPVDLRPQSGLGERAKGARRKGARLPFECRSQALSAARAPQMSDFLSLICSCWHFLCHQDQW